MSATADVLRFYDALAPTYRATSAARAAYLTAVDDLVVSAAPADASSLLDVGAGDGVRALGIARAAGIDSVVLVEPSTEMARACRAHGVGKRGDNNTVWDVRAEELPLGEHRFDLITCLWNVLGHVPDRAARVEALRRMGASLGSGGVIVVDVNHRYNAAEYGWGPTLRRMLHDRLRPSETNGDVAFVWRAGDTEIPATGHVFTHREVCGLVRDAGLRIAHRWVVDYATGALRRRATGGQLVYVLGACPSDPLA